MDGQQQGFAIHDDHGGNGLGFAWHDRHGSTVSIR